MYLSSAELDFELGLELDVQFDGAVLNVVKLARAGLGWAGLSGSELKSAGCPGLDWPCCGELN